MSSSTYESGYEYQIIGSRQIQILDEEKCQKLEDALDNIFEKYSSCFYISSPAVFSYLTDELKNMTKTLKIDFVNNKISNGTRNNTLLAVADSLIANHYNLNRLSIIINNNIYKDIMFLINILSHV